MPIPTEPIGSIPSAPLIEAFERWDDDHANVRALCEACVRGTALASAALGVEP